MNVNFPCIWRANRYQHKLVPVNTASAEELQQAGLSPGTANYIVAARSSTVRGFDLAALKHELSEASQVWQYGVSSADVSKLDQGFTF
jgi:hypothetical protein